MKRRINILELLNKNSYFLFGPRGVGKSFLIRQSLTEFDAVDHLDLLQSKLYLLLKSDPSQLENLIQSQIAIIDEIQRIPELLNEVHRLIEEKKIVFLLTGSSARSLRKKGVNLLAGRAYKAELMPLCWSELNAENQFDFMKYLTVGGMPKSYINGEHFEYLYAYIDNYLKEEIQAEALVRNLANYQRFIEVAALHNCEVINFTKTANDAQLSPNTVRDYYKILEDTLLSFWLEPWTKSIKRKAIQSAKLYFCDIGLVNALAQIEHVPENSEHFGKCFEHFIVLEVRAYLSYTRSRKRMYFWRSTSQMEVDLIIGQDIAVEIKASKHTNDRDQKGLKAIMEEQQWKHLFVVSQDPHVKTFDNGIVHIPWWEFFERLWRGEVV